ncbi:MAG: cation:proton antiporter [Bacteroidota bacterium]|nr:cation:proton antiporter [Bacteroidota bacterium]
MPQEITILRDVFVIFSAVIIVLLLFRKLRIPTVVGFITTGILIGPPGLQLIRDTANIHLLAEVGVVLLLFTIGLEFPADRLKQMRKTMLIGGGLQLFVTIGLTASIVSLFQINIGQAIFIGFIISVSSTAIVMKILSERRETNAPHSKISLGILVFQDICFIPMMLLVPVLGGTSEVIFTDISYKLGVGFLTITIVVIAGRYLMPRLFRWLVRFQSREVFVLGIVLVSIGTAWFTSLGGLSLALGAFIAGLVLSESEYSHQIFSEILPMRDTLASLFFISIGMLLDMNHVMHSFVPLIGSVLGLIIIKFIVLVGVVLILKYPIRIAITVGLALSQVGEFSFILAREGYTSGLLSNYYYQNLLAIAIITMLATPFMIKAGSRLAPIVNKIFPKQVVGIEDISSTAVGKLEGHVIIVGYGLNGRNLANVLRETGIPYIILDLDGDAVRNARSKGEAIMYGDGTRSSILSQVHIEKAKVLVIAFSDQESVKYIVRTARNLNPHLYIIVRTHYLSEMEKLYEFGANQVIPEEFEASIEIFTRVLREYHIPRNVITAQVDLLHNAHYSMMRGLKLPETTMNQLEAILAAGTTDTFLVLNDSPAVGKTLGDLNLRNVSGASIIAIVHKDQPITNPPLDYSINTGDILVLIGTHAQVDAAFELLSPHSKTSDF